MSAPKYLPDTGRTRHWPITAALLTGALTMFAILSVPLARHQVFLEDDISACYLPLRYLYAQAIEHGWRFIWTPHLFSGFYIHAEGQGSMTHPLNYLLYRFLPFTEAFDLDLLLNYPLMFAGMLLLLRRWNVRGDAALMGALMGTFGGFCMSYYIWFHVVRIVAHMPWMLLAIDVAMRSSNARHSALALVAVVLLTASQWLCGYPQMVLILGIAEGLYVLFMLPDARSFSRVFLLLTAKTLGLAVAGIQLLPTFELAFNSDRAHTDYAYRMAGSLHPLNLLQLLNPYFFQWRIYSGTKFGGLYCGAIASVLAPCVLLRPGFFGLSRRHAAWLTTLIVVGVIFGMGRYGYVYRLISTLPVLNMFRAPERYNVWFHLAWIWLTVFGLRRLLAAEPIPWRILIPAIIVPIASVCITVTVLLIRKNIVGTLSASTWVNAHISPASNLALGVLLILSAAVLVIAAARGWHFVTPLLVLLLMVDLGLFGLRHKTADRLDSFVASLDIPAGSTEFAMAPDYRPHYMTNGGLFRGFRSPLGYTAIYPLRHLNYYLDPLPLRLVGVRWLRTRYGATTELAEALERGEKWVELSNPMPRVRLVTQTEISTKPAEDIKRIDIATTALLDHPVTLDAGGAGEASILHEEPGLFHIQTQTPGRQLLILTEAYHAGWRMTVDGQAQAPLRVYGDLLGCVVGPGAHRVDLAFDPASYLWGKRVSLAGLIAVIIFGVLAFAGFKHKQTREGSQVVVVGT